MHGQVFHNGDDRLIEVARGFIQGDGVEFPVHLQAEAVVAQNDEGHHRGTDAEEIGTHDHLPHRPAAADVAHKERRRHTPDHPVGPVEDRPVLREGRGPQGVGPGGKTDEILHHVADGR